MKIEEGQINIGTPTADALGYTADKFDGWLWKKGGEIWVSFIISKQPGQGNFRALVKNILGTGHGVVVPNPSKRMMDICVRLGFTYERRQIDVGGDVDVIDVLCSKQGGEVTG